MKKLNFTSNRKGMAAMALATVLTLVLSACGSGEEVQEAASTPQKEFVYVAEYIEPGDGEGSFHNMCLAGNHIYYTQYVSDQEAGTWGQAFVAYSLETGETRKLPVPMPENGSTSQYVVDAEENIYTVVYSWGEPDESGMSRDSQALCKYDAQGNEVYHQDLTEILASDENNNWIGNMAVDSQGRVYITSDSLIRLFDAQGNFQGSVAQNNGWINSIGEGKDGSIYISYYDQSSSSGGMVLSEVDFEGKKLGQTFTGYPSGNGSGNLAVGVEKDFLINDGARVYEYDLTTQTYQVLLEWLDSDINGSYVSSVSALEDGKLLAVIDDWETGETEFARLTKTPYAELPQKTQLTIGTLYDSQSLQAAAVAFNKSSDTYRINIKAYIDSNNWTETSWQDGINALNSDITSKGNCPDILDLSNLDVQMLASKGALEDLGAYLENSTVVSREDFLESIVKGYTFDGKLACIPGRFSLSTMAGRTAEVGTEMGWTMEELMAYGKEHPEASLLDGTTKSSMLYLLMHYGQGNFVDWESGKCSFDSEGFKQLLNFVNSLPDEYNWESDDRSTPVKIQEGDVLLDQAYIYNLDSIQECEAKFGEPVTYIGLPNAEGTSGCYFTGSEMYGMAAKSENKEGAWAFIEGFLAKEPDDRFSWGLPSNRKHLEDMIAEETKVEYILDENGQPMLDEDGEPMTSSGTASIGYGDWEYTYHTPTEEEVGRLRELIDAAVPAFAADQEILEIIQEEAEAFFQGQKTVDDVAGIIQSRAQVYMNENS